MTEIQIPRQHDMTKHPFHRQHNREILFPRNMILLPKNDTISVSPT